MLPTIADPNRSTAPPRPRTLRTLRTRTLGTRVLGALGVLVTLGALLLGTASPASAHAVLTGSSPAADSVVGSAPEEVVLTFSESVSLADDGIRVLAPDGEQADTGELKDRSGSGVVKHAVPLKTGLADGTYTVAWKAVSADSHPIGGAYTFSIGAASKTSVSLPGSEVGGGSTGFLYDVSRYAAYAGFVLLVGGAAFVLACWREGARAVVLQRLVSGGWAVLAGATVAMLLLRGPYTGSGSLSDAFDLEVLRETLDTKSGTALVSRLLLLAAAAVFLSVLFGTYARGHGAEGPDGDTDGDGDRDRDGDRDGDAGADAERDSRVRTPSERRDLYFGLCLGGTVVAAGLATTWALSEHASTGIQTSVAMPVAVVHLLAVACWLGGLTSLFTTLHRGTPPSVAATRRFSRLALSCVIVLAATGLYQAWRQVGSWSALTGTDYGVLLLVKTALITVLIGFGWISRRWTGRLAERAAAGTDGDSGPDMDTDTGSGSGTGTGTGTGTGEGTGSGRGTAKDAGSGTARAPETVTVILPARTADPDSAVESDAESDSNSGSAPASDPVRAAQLARQRTAAAKARRKRRRDADVPRAGLRLSVLCEASIALVVLAVATLLSGTEPGRTEEAVEGSGGSSATASKEPVGVEISFDTGGPDGRGTAEISLDPGRSGSNKLTIRATDPAGKPLDLPEVRVALTQPAKELGPLRSAPAPVGKGQWEDPALRLPVPGSWRLAVTIRSSDIDQVTETRTVRVP